MKSITIFLCSLAAAACVFLMNAGVDPARTPGGGSILHPPGEPEGARRAGFPYEALQWRFRMRAHPAGEIPAEWREKAIGAMDAAEKRTPDRAPSSITWLALGPDDVGGRVRSIAIDPSNPSVIYCGSVSGGVWKTTNGGSNWFPTNDMAASLVIGALAIDPNNTSIVYAGTGEGYFNVDALRGAGMLKSTDGGATWALTTTFSSSPSGFPYYINDIYIRPDNSSLLFAATNSGLYRSTNAGTSWLYVPKNTGTRRATQIAAHPSSPGTFYVAYGNFSTDGIYKTTDGGANFTKLAGGFPTTGFTRISMAISKSNPSVLYAVLADAATFGTHSIQKTTDGGATWTAVGTPTDPIFGTHLGTQGWYNNVVAVHPSDPDSVFAGGINNFLSVNGGTSWVQRTSGTGGPYPSMHVDQHAIAFHPTADSIIYFGNDGGMFRTTNGGATFTKINTGLAITQFYSGAAHPLAEIFYGGTQDNGTLRTLAPPAWTAVVGGDGGATAVDPAVPTTVYTEYIYLNFLKSLNSGASWLRSMNGIPTSGGAQTDGTSDRCAFIAPFALDPANPQTIVAGTYRVYRTTNGAALWNAISPDLTGEPGGANGVGSQNSVISALAVAPSASGTIYAGTTGFDSAARVQVTTNTGTTWSNVTKSPLPNRAVSSIAVDPTNASRAFVAFSGYNTNTPTTPGHLFRTTNRGGSWTNVSSNLPDVPVNAVVIDSADPQAHLFVGTDVGVFETTDGGTSWTERNQGLARVAVFDLDVRPDGILVAATHGRGMFRTAGSITTAEDPPPGLPAAHRLEQNYPNPFNPGTTIAFDIASVSEVRLAVYDAAGRLVATLHDGRIATGRHTRLFDGGALATGVYLAVLEVAPRSGAPGFREMRKMLLVR